ncbi:helix-turn-helix domain-containing protein [Aquimarina celericrescens]|uniref:Helix-turn-helix domain-containing protein n=1 Tax=Aquimarina celericrescens TaxID=1964542 RepID=A0ABW5AXD4_9FLAO|nr:helix-turn-helix domain-containing protein [Aquimarina celericrescens]
METLEILLIILLCIGAIQGIIFGIILWQRKVPNYIANRFLSTILFFFSYRLIVETLKIFGLGRYDAWYHILLEYNWIYGTLIFFFVKSYVTPNFRIKRSDYSHFLPVFMEFVWSNFIKTQNFYWDGTRESLSWLGYWGYVVWMRYPTMYIISGLLIVFYTSKAQKVLNDKSQIEGFQLLPEKIKWIRRVVWVLKIFSFLYVGVVLIDFFFFGYTHNFYGHPVFISMAIITYWLGLEGFSRRKESAFKLVAIVSNKEKEQLSNIASKLEAKMKEEMLYKNPELTLSVLSKQLDEKPYLVTKCLNTIFNKKFNDYINEFRIEEVKQLIKDPKNNNLTLLAIAHEAGFNSKASFNRAVKKITGNAPSDLKNSI